MKKLLVLLILTSGCIQQQTGGEQGFLEGAVSFVGLPCPPEQARGPPCDGPYPNYEIIVYETDGKTMAARTVSDENGNYNLSLSPGSYVIYTQRGPLKDDVRTNRVRILSGKTTRLDLIIDTGIR